MAQERSLDIQRVTEAMDATRRSIRETAGELGERVHQTADWRHYVARHPVATLCVAAAGGLALARILIRAGRVARNPMAGSSRSGVLRYALAGLGVAGELGALRSVIGQVRQLAARRDPRPPIL